MPGHEAADRILVGVSVLWPQIAALAAYGVLVVGLSALRFRKKLD